MRWSLGAWCVRLLKRKSRGPWKQLMRRSCYRILMSHDIIRQATGITSEFDRRIIEQPGSRMIWWERMGVDGSCGARFLSNIRWCGYASRWPRGARVSRSEFDSDVIRPSATRLIRWVNSTTSWKWSNTRR